jgi:hypothetical protein
MRNWHHEHDGLPGGKSRAGAMMRLLLSVVMLLLAAPPAGAQDTTFIVTVADKTAQHPFFNQGWPEAFVVDGVQGQELTLTRGETYTFQMQNVPSIHPFYISTSQSGGGAGIFSEGVTGNFASGNQILTFTPTEHSPDLLYYQCQAHDFMGGRINITGVVTSSEPGQALPAAFSLQQNYPNPFNPSTRIRFHLTRSGFTTLTVYDMLGREIVSLVRGELAPGAHEVIWNGADQDGRFVDSGMYLYRLSAVGHSESRVMALIK